MASHFLQHFMDVAFMDGPMTFHVCGHDLPMHVFFFWSLLFIAVGVVSAGLMYRREGKEAAAALLISWGIAGYALFAAKVVYDQVDSLYDMMSQSLVYVASLFLFCLAAWRVDDARKKQPGKVMRKSYMVVVTVTLLVISYTAVIDYSMSVFRYIPVSRGGAKPEFRVDVTVPKEAVPTRQLDGFAVKQEGRFLTIRKVFLIGEDDEHFLVASHFDPRPGRQAKVLSLKKSDVLFWLTVYRASARHVARAARMPRPPG